MRDPSNHILFLVTEYEAGMRPYASAIIHALWRRGDHMIVVIKNEYFKHDFDDLPRDSITWIDYPASKSGKLQFRLYPARLIHAIDELISEQGIRLIYSLTEELVLAGYIARLQRRCPVLYTVHDAIHHDVKFNSLSAWLKDRLLMALPQRRMLDCAHQVVTNSHIQLDHILSHYPDHKAYYAPFPTLVNDAIAAGEGSIPELRNVKDGYILFFGNLHLYKGVHLLYDAYLSHRELHDRPLVIAGGKEIYFERQQIEDDVIFINRFIGDNELKDLFTRAAVVVYPYISATQSGVTSIASYFGVPMVLSDLPFFIQTCEGYDGIGFFKTGDCESLAAAIKRSLLTSASTTALYRKEYATEAMRDALEGIIAAILN